jgi:hypothetical protein
MTPEDTADPTLRRLDQWAGGGIGTQTPIVHELGEMQSAADWHGKAHFPYCVLQWWVPQMVSFWQGSASGPGVAMAEPVGAGAAPGAGPGAGYPCGAGCGAGYGAGAGYGCAVYAGAVAPGAA